jgi:hypothetical protein
MSPKGRNRRSLKQSLKPTPTTMTTENTDQNLIIDAEAEITGLPPGLHVLKFDKQGHVTWDKELFASQLYIPICFQEGKAADKQTLEGKRPLNGHFAIWLEKHQDQIPEQWKEWEMLFIGTIICHEGVYVRGACAAEQTCLKLWFADERWQCSVFNLAHDSKKSNHRIPLLPV